MDHISKSEVPDLGFPFASAYNRSSTEDETNTKGIHRSKSTSTASNLQNKNRNKQNLVLSTSFVSTRRLDNTPISPITVSQNKRHRNSITKTILGLKNEVSNLQHELTELKKKKEDTERLRSSTASDIYAGGYSTDHLQKHSIRIKANAQIRELDKHILKLEKQMKASKDQMEHLRRPDSDLETLKTNSENLSREDLHTAEEDLGTGIFRIGTQKSQLSEEQSKKKNDTNEDEMIAHESIDPDHLDSSFDDTVSMSEQTVNLESATWLVSNYLESFQEPNVSTDFVLEKANGLVDLLKENPDIRSNLVLDSFMPSIQRLLLRDDNLITSAAYRVCRHLIDGRNFIDLLFKLHIDTFIIISLSYDNSHQLEREQAFKLIRAFVEYNHGISKGILQAVISCIEKSDDPLKNMALETLLELCYISPEMVKECHGIRILEGILQEYYSFSLANIVLDTILNLMSNHNTRKYFIKDFDISVLATIFADVNPKSSINIEKIQNSTILMAKALKSFNGCMLFSMNNFQPLRELLAFFQVPNCAPYLIDLFLDILRIKSLPYRPRNKGVQQFRMQPSEYYRECVSLNQKIALKIMILEQGGFQENINNLISVLTNNDTNSTLATKARYLLSEYLNLKLNLVDKKFPINKNPQIIEDNAKTYEETFEFAKMATKMSRHRNTVGMNFIQYVEKNKAFVQNYKENTLVREVDDLRFRRMVYDSKVLQTKDFVNWNWNIIQELFEGPLMNSTHLDELAKSTKFIRRLLVFYRPLRLRFSNVNKTAKLAQKYIHVGCLFFKMLTSTNEGLKLLMDDTKIIPQLASLLFRALEGNTSGNIFNENTLKNKIVSGYFKFIGVLTETKGGIKVLARWNFFTVIYKMFQFQSKFASKCLFLVLADLHLQHSAHCRTVMGKALVVEDEEVRISATKRLGELLIELNGSKVASEIDLENKLNVQHYKMELLTRQLYDLSPKVVAVADRALYEYIVTGNESEESSGSTFKLFLNQMVFIRSPILFEILGRPYGFQLLNEIDFVKDERDSWLEKKNIEYVDIVEEFMEQSPRNKRNNHYEQRDRLPLHFYESLAKTEDGILFLSQTGDFLTFMNIIKDYVRTEMDDEGIDIIKNLKACLWCCGFIGSTELGIGLLDNYSLVDDIVNVAYKASVTSVRYTAFYTLGLISKTLEGCEILDQLGWNCCISVIGKPIGIALPNRLDRFLSFNEEPWNIQETYEEHLIDMNIQTGELITTGSAIKFDLFKLLAEKNALENPFHKDDNDMDLSNDSSTDNVLANSRPSDAISYLDSASSSITRSVSNERANTTFSAAVFRDEESQGSPKQHSNQIAINNTPNSVSQILDMENSDDERITNVLNVVSQLGNHIMSNKAMKVITDMNAKYGSDVFGHSLLFMKVLQMMSTFRFKPPVRKFLCGLIINKRNLGILIDRESKNQKLSKLQNN